MIFVHDKIAQIDALLIMVDTRSAIHYYHVLPRAHIASQQPHGKLKIDSVMFYTHKSLHITAGLDVYVGILSATPQGNHWNKGISLEQEIDSC